MCHLLPGLHQILAALDVHTSKWIVEKCLKGDLLRGRTIILVVRCACVSRYRALTIIRHLQTHNIALASPVADFVVHMDSNGRILSHGSLASVLEQDSDLVKEVLEEREELEKAEQEIDVEKPEDALAKQASGKLVVDEEVEVGHVGWTARM